MYVSPVGYPLLLALMSAGCRRAGSRFVLVDIGVEFAASRLTRRLFASCLRTAAHVSVRDDLSRRVVRAADPSRPVLQVPDLVFAHPAGALPKPDAVPKRVVVGVISAEHSLGSRGSGYEQRMVDLVLELLGHDLEVVLVGGDTSDAVTARVIADRVASSDPQSRRPQLSLVDDYADLVAVLASAEVVVASRYHNLVAAIQAARPTLSIGYAEKCTQLLDSVGLGNYAYELAGFDPLAVGRDVVEMLADSETVANRVQVRSRAFAREVETLLAHVADDMGLGTWSPPASRDETPNP